LSSELSATGVRLDDKIPLTFACTDIAAVCSFSEAGMAPIAVITHADELELEDWEDVRGRVKKELGLQNEVFMLDNSEKATKTFARDKALYLILRSALQSAHEFIKSSEARKK
jgi:hypothetical protein